MFFEIFLLTTIRNKKRRATKRERERERDDHIFSNRSIHARIRTTPFYFFREKKKKKKKKTKREILNSCANSVRFLDFPIERERERERLWWCVLDGEVTKTRETTTMDDRDDDDDDAKKKSDDVEEGGKEVLSRFLEDAAKAQEKDYLNSMRVGNSKSMKELARYDAGQNMEMRREMKKEKRGDDPNEEEERRRVVVAETEQLRSASRMMTANDEDDLNLDGKHQSSFADLNYNSSGSDFTRGVAAPEIHRSLFTRRREMEEEEEEEEEGWEEPRGSDAYFSKHFNNHPCSPGSGGRRNTTDRNFNSIGLGLSLIHI